jgi:hypothetical protein
MKNLMIAGAVGTLFMAGGFVGGMKFMPKPPVPAPGTTVAGVAAATPAPEPISIEALKRTSESMMNLNQALQEREQKVALREQAVKAREDEMDAERAALNNSHDKFKTLFAEFQSRLQLVEASQADELQKQAALYTSMDGDQAVEMIRAMDDPAVTRLFSVIDTKPLSKLVGSWKTKYPVDIPRLLHVLDGMAQVLPKDKMALSDTSVAPDSTSTAAPSSPDAAPAPDAPAPAPDATTPAAPTTPDPTAPAPDSAVPANDSTNPNDSTPAPAQPQPPEHKTDRVSTATTN